MFTDVIPWALARATHPETVRLKRIAFNEAAQFPEFSVSAESMMRAGRQRAVTDLSRRYEERETIKVDDLELVAEHFLAMVEERQLQFAVRLFPRGVMPR